MPDFPSWPDQLAITSLLLGGFCAATIAVDEPRRPQKMVMNAVWPLTALFGSVPRLTAYYRWGRASPVSDDRVPNKPFAGSVLTGTNHCGAGCTIGDIITEWTAFAGPPLAIWFGYGTLFRQRMFAIWIPDFLAAFLIGIAFKYYAIKPMRELSVGRGIMQAFKADTISISAWQIGMDGAMALLQFGWFRQAFGHIAPITSPEFWLAMQIAMLAGFATSYPANWWLIRAAVKEHM